MRWRDGHEATLARHGGRMPREDEVRHGDVLVPGTCLETDDGPDEPVGRWRILLNIGEHLFAQWDDRGELVVRPVPDGVKRCWDLWDMRAYVAGRGQPEAVALGLSSPRAALLLAKALDRSRFLRLCHAALTGLSRTAAALRREWRQA